MAYFKEIKIPAEGVGAALYVTDDAGIAETMRKEGKAVLIYLHPGSAEQDFTHFLFAVEDPEDLEEEYVERVYRRLKGLPWRIAETQRCIIRETVPEDVEEFYRIYSNPAITRYMDGLYPDIEQEKAYIREYIEKVYTFYGFGVWTVVEKESGAVIGRAGISYREGFEDPELGFIIGVPWQRKGYAREVCRAVLEYAWKALDFDCVQALVEPENIPSLHLCEELGFMPDGRVTVRQKEYCRLLVRKKN